MFRFGCVCGGASLYAPQAQNNVVRVAYEAMAAVLGGVQSMFTAAWDEAFALPTEESTHAGAAHAADPRATRPAWRTSSIRWAAPTTSRR